MRRWTAAVVLVCAASLSALPLPLHAQAPEPAPNAPTSEEPPAEEPTTEGASPSDPSSASAATSDATPGGSNEATPSGATPSEATPTDAAPTEANPSSTPSTASAQALARPIAPPPPAVAFDDERAAPPTEEPRPRSALRERFVIFSPGWMPIGTLGYRAQFVRYRGGGVSSRDTSHGLTSGVLAPVLATGDSSSRARLALGVGMGLDVAWRSRPPHGPMAVTVTGESIYLNPGFVERNTHVYAALAALLRVVLERTTLVASFAWLPGRRFRRVEEETSTTYLGSTRSYSTASFARSRLTFGVARGPFHVAVFTGIDRISNGWLEVEVGSTVGVGW